MSTGNASVDKIIDTTIGHEGAYSNNSADRGGATMWGITETVARAHGFKGDMRLLPRATAVNIYEADYWFGPRFDLVQQVSPLIAAELFDTGVNMGPSVPAKFFQRWLNVFNNQQKLYPDLIADGQIGPRTINGLKQYLSARGKDAEKVMVRALNCSQGNRYLELSEGREANETFTYGWLLNRVGAL